MFSLGLNIIIQNWKEKINEPEKKTQQRKREEKEIIIISRDNWLIHQTDRVFIPQQSINATKYEEEKKGYCNKTTYIPQQSISTKIVRKKNYYILRQKNQILKLQIKKSVVTIYQPKNQQDGSAAWKISFSSIQYNYILTIQ